MAETTTKVRDIGVDVQNPPTTTCDDKHCPFHGGLPVRGQIITGKVATKGMQRSVVISRQYTIYIPKYERYETRTSKISAHAPACFDEGLEPGQEVTIMECRPVSKTKKYVVIDRRI
ncbi:MAG: 30S ribosomal protein S17 [Euryarchaeota archaeon]|nr:30S ribosomal protein S17 [Euryarchaeota archaeon]